MNLHNLNPQKTIVDFIGLIYQGLEWKEEDGKLHFRHTRVGQGNWTELHEHAIYNQAFNEWLTDGCPSLTRNQIYDRLGIG
jgi:hypothetical protein